MERPERKNARLKDILIGAAVASALWLGGNAWKNHNDDVIYKLERAGNPSCYRDSWGYQLFCNPDGNDKYLLPLESFIGDGKMNEEFRDYLRYPAEIDPKTAMVEELEIRIKLAREKK